MKETFEQIIFEAPRTSNTVSKTLCASSKKMGATWGWVIRSLATSDDSLAIETRREQIVVTILIRNQKEFLNQHT